MNKERQKYFCLFFRKRKHFDYRIFTLPAIEVTAAEHRNKNCLQGCCGLGKFCTNLFISFIQSLNQSVGITIGSFKTAFTGEFTECISRNHRKMTFQFVYLNPYSSCFKAVTTIINIDQWKFVFQPFFFFFLFLIKDEICVLPPGFQLLLARVLCSALSAFGKNSPDVVLVFLLCSGVTIDLYSFSFRYSTAQTQQYLQVDN